MVSSERGDGQSDYCEVITTSLEYFLHNFLILFSLLNQKREEGRCGLKDVDGGRRRSRIEAAESLRTFAELREMEQLCVYPECQDVVS